MATSDLRKHDGTLCIVIAGTASEHERLMAFLEDECDAGRLRPASTSPTALLVTRAVFERMGRQISFIDGADGGQTAEALKAQLKGEESIIL